MKGIHLNKNILIFVVMRIFQCTEMEIAGRAAEEGRKTMLYAMLVDGGLLDLIEPSISSLISLSALDSAEFKAHAVLFLSSLNVN